MSTPSPSTHFGFLMQHIGLDLFSYANKDYLICVNHWSGYLHFTSSTAVIFALTTWLNLFGWPSSIRSDGGPQFRGKFTRFCETNKISAPYNPKSNGLAEAGVKSVKNILRKSMSSGSNADFMLYEWRNVPRSDGYSPAQLMYGRAQRTSLPSLPSQSVPIDFSSAASSKDAAHARAKLDHDRSKLPPTRANQPSPSVTQGPLATFPSPMRRSRQAVSYIDRAPTPSVSIIDRQPSGPVSVDGRLDHGVRQTGISSLHG